MNTKKFHELIIRHSLLTKHDKVIVGVSAGPDSVALLSLLCSSGLSIQAVAVYIDHGLRPHETPAEISLVRKLSEDFGIENQIVTVDVKTYGRQHKVSIEEGCRLLRYDALEKCRAAHNAAAIAVGHTSDDQAEEILLRLFKGTGLKGLSGMRLKNGSIIRPLLQSSKTEVLQYLNENKLTYCIDSSNTDRSFLRNRLRLDILPQIETHCNPSIRITLCRTAEILDKDEDLLDSLAEMELDGCISHTTIGGSSNLGIKLDTTAFNGIHLALQRRIMEKICWKFGSTPTYHHILTLCEITSSANDGAELHLPQGLRVVKTQGTLLFSQPHGRTTFRGSHVTSPLEPQEILLNTPCEFEDIGKLLSITPLTQHPDTLAEGDLLVDGEKIIFPLIVRSHTPGERFTPSGMTGTKKIARFLADLKIAKHERGSYPVLLSGYKIVAVAGLRVDDYFSVTEKTREYLCISWQSLQKLQH